MDMTEATDINVTSGHLIVDLPSVGGIVGQRSIGVNFRSQWAETGLSPADSAGAFAQTNWNNTDGSSSGGTGPRAHLTPRAARDWWQSPAHPAQL